MRTIIWDYYGTIIDDVHLCLEVEQFMLKDHALIHLIANSPALRLVDPAPAATLPEQAII